MARINTAADKAYSEKKKWIESMEQKKLRNSKREKLTINTRIETPRGAGNTMNTIKINCPILYVL